MALISEKKFIINPVKANGYTGDNQSNYYSQTALLNTRIEFKSSKEHSTDESSEDEDISTQLKSKYHVLLPDSSERSKQFYPNDSLPLNKLRITITRDQNKLQDGNELGEPKQILYPRENIILEWKKINRIGSGLINLGNTCFMNSVLQCLTYCPPLVNYLFSIKEEHSGKCRLNFCMICLMIKHVSLVSARNLPAIKPLYICQRLKSIAKHFNFGRQEDAHEFLRYVIDHMWRSCLSSHEHEMGIAGITSKFDHFTKSTTAINQIFGGYHRSQVLCSICKEKSNTYDYFMDFMLDIQNVSSLEEALQKFVTPEVLRNDNAYKCSKCKRTVAARKHFTVHRAPNVATFQFKRFDCSRMFGKITKPISYPERLDLRPYMSDNKGPPIAYKLISVLVHLGSSSNSGHYYCYVRNSNNCWYLMDDSHVTQVSLNDVLSQRAYVLFYIRVPSESIQNVPKSVPLSTHMNVISKTSVKLDNVSQFQGQNKHFNSTFIFSQNTSPEKLSNGSVPISANILKSNVIKNLKNILESKKTNSNPTSPLKQNVFNKKSNENLNTVIQKSTLLVPYEKDSDDDSINESVQLSQKDNSKEQPELRLSSNNSQSLPTQNKLNSASSSSREMDPPIPILKVKATTNSWQVVESTPSIKQSHEEKTLSKTQSNWKISVDVKGSDERSNGESSKFNFVKINEFKEDNSHTETLENIKKSKKKKKQKRDKEKKKRESHDSGSDDETEFNWVERTKETLEMETKTPYNEKRKNCDNNSNEEMRKKIKVSEDAPKNNNILDALLRNASRGYGDNVKSWDGGEANLNKAISADKKSDFLDYDDEYNEEFDQGKEKKTKKLEQPDIFKYSHIKNNQFQMAYHSKYVNNSYESNFSRNSSHKFQKFDPKDRQGNFKPMNKFNDNNHHKGQHFEKHHSDKPFSYDKNGRNSHYNNHHRKSNPYKKKNNNFKHR